MKTWALALVLLSACSGEMSGLVYGDAGQSGRAEFRYSGLGEGEVWATLSDGEQFSGTYVRAKSHDFWSGAAVTGSAWTSLSGSNTTLTNQYEAVLFGDRGNSMKCFFQGSRSRGVGRCEISDGRQVDIQW